MIPLTVNCWPEDDGTGNINVNIDYELLDASLKLEDVVISIPLPSGVTPVVSSADGDYEVDA